MNLTRGQLTIIVRPSVREKPYPFTAYIGGTQIEGYGSTVQRAIEDLLTSDEAGKACRKLEREVES